MSPLRTALAAALTLAALLAPPDTAAAASGTYTLHDVKAGFPACVRITDKEEGAILLANTCAQAITLVPIDGACLGCDPATTLAPSEIGWYGLAPTLPGDEADATGPREVRWQQEGGRSGTLTATVAFIAPLAEAGGGCAIHPGVPAGGAGLALFTGALLGLRRRRRR
ncbi:MAG: hypothetical protein R3F65_09900 [bacterium]